MGTPAYIIPIMGKGSAYSTKSVEFDGVDEYAAIADAASLSFGNGVVNSPFSISAWIFMGVTTSFNILSKGANSINGREYSFGTNGVSKLTLEIWGPTWDDREARLQTGTMAAHVNVWKHVTCTFDGSDGTSASAGMNLYIDGVVEASGANDFGTHVAMSNTTNGAQIGRFLNAATYASGNVDEVSLWDKALSGAEVSEIYNSGCPKNLATHSAYANLVSWWRMGEGDTYPTLSDSKGTNHATLTNTEAADIEDHGVCFGN